MLSIFGVMLLVLTIVIVIGIFTAFGSGTGGSGGGGDIIIPGDNCSVCPESTVPGPPGPA